jgi:hypothetical protein
MQEKYKYAMQKVNQTEREVALLKNQMKQKDEDNKEAAKKQKKAKDEIK